MDNRLFREQAHIGQTWAEHVASALSEANIRCNATPLEFAKSEEEIALFENEQDIIFHGMNGCIEVKSRGLRFTENPATFPYSTAYVDTVSGWNKKQPEPLAVVLVSQITKAKLVIPTSSRPTWGTQRAYDRVREYSDTWYTVPRTNLRPFTSLVDWLLERQERHAR